MEDGPYIKYTDSVAPCKAAHVSCQIRSNTSCKLMVQLLVRQYQVCQLGNIFTQKIKFEVSDTYCWFGCELTTTATLKLVLKSVTPNQTAQIE